MRLRTAALVSALALVSAGAHADEMTQLLKKGPLVRVETTSAGKYKEGLAIADVDAPADQVWEVLTSFDAYRFFMPRIDELDVKKDGDDWLVKFDLDTPLVSTSYTNRYSLDAAKREIRVRQVAGDLDGTHFTWRLVPRGENRTRVYYRGVVKNFSSIAQRLEDDQQTITIGINVSSMLSVMNVVKARAETLHRQKRGATPPATSLRKGD